MTALRSFASLFALSLVIGCDAGPQPTPATPSAPAAASGSAFAPAACGRITGRVVWRGEPPVCPSLIFAKLNPDGGFTVGMTENPHAPKLNPAGHALADAVVYLKGVSPAVAKPWDLPAVRVEMADQKVRVRQGDGEPRRVGFVRRGGAVTMESKDVVFHSLRGRGADFFTLAFPDHDKPLSRALDRTGLVHLTSGAGYYWASAHLFVADEPYFAVTDSDGRFAFDGVPSGRVEVVAWHPNWNVVRHERDPEACVITRQHYGEPFEAAVPVNVEKGRSAEVTVTLSEKR